MIDIHPDVRAALESGSYTRCHLIDFELKGVTLRYTENGIDIDYNGLTYLANGLMLDMGTPKYTSEMRVNETQIAFSATDQTTLAIILNNPQYNSRVIVSRAYLDENNNVLGTPIVLNNWRVVGWSTKDSSMDESIITLKLANEFADWAQARGRRTTPASQKRHYPDDEGMEFAASIQKAQKWGSK